MGFLNGLFKKFFGMFALRFCFVFFFFFCFFCRGEGGRGEAHVACKREKKYTKLKLKNKSGK